MDTGSSVSKGCFAFKGKKKIANLEDYFHDRDDPVTWKNRLEVFQNLWEAIDTEIQILQADLNTKIFDDLLKFTSTCHCSFTLDVSHQTSVHKELPTAALVTGVNTPDHAVMFSTLVTLMQERVSPHIAKLRSKDCNSVKNILTKTLEQFLQKPELFLDEDEVSDINQKKLPCTLSTLAAWYKEHYTKEGGSSPKKKKSLSGKPTDCVKYPPVVIVFEDLESFIPQVIQDFIIICSNYLQQLPLIFVFGIATSVSAVHRLLPNSVSSILCMEKFQAPPSVEYLTLVINQIVMTPNFPFKLGSKVFQLLLDIFLYHDFSVLNFIKGLHFCMMDHFFSNPVSQLCCPVDEVKDEVKRLTKDDVEQIRQLPSFMKYVESCPPEKIAPLLTNDDALKKETVKLLSDLHQYHTTFYPVLECLHTLVCKLPRHPLGKQLREVYCVALDGNIFESKPYQDAMDLLKLMSRDELQELVQQCKTKMAEWPSELSEFVKPVDDIITKFENIDAVKDEEDDSPSDDTTGKNEVVLQKTDMYKLRQDYYATAVAKQLKSDIPVDKVEVDLKLGVVKLLHVKWLLESFEEICVKTDLTLEEMKMKKRKQTPYEKLRDNTLQFFDENFRKYLLCPKKLPLYEILYYESYITVKQHLNAAPRSSIQTALSNPHHYLQCKCCEGDHSGIISTMPDLCIVYKLHLECGQLINLYDWLQAFVMVVTPEEDSDEQAKAPDKLLQARFIRAVSELQFLGFVKPTKRKTDHVARLTWGGC